MRPLLDDELNYGPIDALEDSVKDLLEECKTVKESMKQGLSSLPDSMRDEILKSFGVVDKSEK